MPRKKTKRVARKKSRTTHNPGLKSRMKHSGTRLVHGYETAKRKSKRRKK